MLTTPVPAKSKQLKLPRGLTRFLFRAPIFFYRIGLGFLFGSRFLLLAHTGRKSSLLRQVLLEVVHHDQASDAYYIAAAFGPRSDWYQNLLLTPVARIQVGRRKQFVLASPCDPAEATQVLHAYAAAHPRAAQGLARFMGYQTDGSIEDFAALGGKLKLMRLDPRPDR